jgi:hypothetical protein
MWQPVVTLDTSARPMKSISFLLSVLSESEGVVAGASPRWDSGGDDGGGAETMRVVALDSGDVETPLQCQAAN